MSYDETGSCTQLGQFSNCDFRCNICGLVESTVVVVEVLLVVAGLGTFFVGDMISVTR